jgi:hypothetical protein
MDRAELERRAEAAVRARWGRNPELDDLLVIARTAIELELRAGTAPDRLAQYSLARVLGDCRDHLRMVARQDPLRRPLIATSRTDSVHVTFRIPAALLSAVLKRYPAGSLSQSLRAALEAACER